MAAFIIIIAALISSNHGASPSDRNIVCYELESSECHPQQSKRCSTWNTDSTDQCICTMNGSPIDVYFLLDSTHMDPYTWHHIITPIPSSFVQQCSSLQYTNHYIIQYTNNDTSILSNPTVSQLSALLPTPHGTYASFCHAFAFFTQHVISVNHDNPILLVLITGNEPSDTNIDRTCDIHDSMPHISKTYGVYLPHLSSEVYEPILSYHDAFHINATPNTIQPVTNNLITATICDYVCDISSDAHEYPTRNPTIKPQIAKPTYYKSWSKPRYVARWKNKKQSYKKHKVSWSKPSASESDSSTSSSSSSSKSYGYNGFGWNGRYKSLH